MTSLPRPLAGRRLDGAMSHSAEGALRAPVIGHLDPGRLRVTHDHNGRDILIRWDELPAVQPQFCLAAKRLATYRSWQWTSNRPHWPE